MLLERVEIPFGAQNLVIETGKLAKLSNGSVTVSCGGTVVLATVCMSNEPKEGIDFFPLTVEYQEKTYSAGRIPGGFFKREGRPTLKEILTSRVIDRPLRPLFPAGFFNDVQIVATVLSSDGVNDPDILALIGSSAALMISDIPFNGPIGAVRVGLVDGQFVLNPSYEQRESSDLDLIIAGHQTGIVMIEGESNRISEEKILEALAFGQQAFGPICKIQQDLQRKSGKEKVKVKISECDKMILDKINQLSKSRLNEVYQTSDKEERGKAKDDLIEDLISDMSVFNECNIDETQEIGAKDIRRVFDQAEYEEVRRLVFEENRRADDRGLTNVRPITCEVKVLPCTHGSSLFTRGQTQSLATVTLGTKKDEQLIESLEGTSYNNFMLHYNFPSFSVGETRPMRGPGRREIGHGALAAKSLKAILPVKDDFPYTIRIVSEILESNGSSSMASVCAGSLALMDAGVPIKEAVAGISIGLMTKDDKAVLLTDIMGLEDHFGDMDFKVAGTRSGVTAIQLDLKISQVDLNLLKKAMQQAKEARLVILDKMEAAIPSPRADISELAPRIMTCQVPQEKIGEVIGPGGKVIKKIMEDTGATSIDIDEDGKVWVSSPDKTGAENAVAYILGLVEEPEIGKTYTATVKRVTNFGAFCEFMPGKEGMVHVSELSATYVKDCNDILKVGDKLNLKLIEKDKMNRYNLSKKQAE